MLFIFRQASLLASAILTLYLFKNGFVFLWRFYA
jgi:hypothetical protein